MGDGPEIDFDSMFFHHANSIRDKVQPGSEAKLEPNTADMTPKVDFVNDSATPHFGDGPRPAFEPLVGSSALSNQEDSLYTYKTIQSNIQPT